MKAVVTNQWHDATLQDVDQPTVGEGECLIQLKLAGICGSDVHIYEGHHPTAKAPIIQGHEFVGTLVEAGGKLPESLTIGDRVVVEPLISCGTCEACVAGNTHVCRSLKLLGIHEHGGFAEYVKVPTAKVIRVPDNVPDRLAVLTEPFAVGFHVCQRAELKNGQRALVIGAGPIGLIVAMVAAMSGAEVAISEVSDERLRQAENDFGFMTIDAKNDPISQANKITDGDGFDVVFEVSGTSPGLTFAMNACRVRGRIVQVGFFGKPIEVNLMPIILREQTLVGSRVYAPLHFKRTLPMLGRLLAEKRFDAEKLIAEVRPLGTVQQSIHDMIAGKVTGKILIDPKL
jgi:2-desacetyl-2-hydroxyethyl bacteriochlorophyllide A dehydrogenase